MARNAITKPNSSCPEDWGLMSFENVGRGRETSGSAVSPATAIPRTTATHFSQGRRRSMGERAGKTAQRQ